MTGTGSWYVLVSPSRTRLEIAEAELARSAGAADRYRVLPDELYKVTAAFDADGAPEMPDGVDAEAGPALDRDEKALVRLLQGDLAFAERPFAELVHTLGECGFDIDERWALDRTQDLAASGALRRIGATLRTREEPWRSALTVWRSPRDPVAAGALIASFPEVLHVFERRVPGGMAVLAVVEGQRRVLRSTARSSAYASQASSTRRESPTRCASTRALRCGTSPKETDSQRRCRGPSLAVLGAHPAPVEASLETSASSRFAD